MEGVLSEEASDRMKEIQQLRIKNERLNKFIEIGEAIFKERNIDQLLPLIMSKISKSLNADRSTLFLIDWDSMELWTKFAEGLKSERIIIQMKMGLVGVSVFNRKLVNVANAYQDPRFNSKIDQITGYRTESVISAPFFDKENEVMGAVMLLNKKTGLFTKEDEEKVLETASRLTEMGCVTDLDKDAVADVFEALTSKSYYREALSPEKAFDILKQDIGTKFDENIVIAMEKYWYNE